MNKLLAIIKREYLQKVRTKFFVIMTILGPLMLAVFTVLPALLLNMKTGDTRIAILDQTEGAKLYDSVRNSLVYRVGEEEESNKQPGLAETANSNSKDRMEKAG